MELWSLLHFLMPLVFRSRKEFSYWFANPMNSMIEGASNQNDDLVRRLHGIIRPFILRRLKKDVETQMPGKFEHIVKCQLSRRQVRFLHVLMSCHFYSICTHILWIYADVDLRRVHGSIINASGFETRGKFYGNDECVNAVKEGL
jgi:SNF2-related domain